MSGQRHRLASRLAVLLLCVLLGAVAVQAALAAPVKRTREGAQAARTAELMHQLGSKDPQVVKAAIDALAEREEASVLVAFFAEGQPDAVADHVLSALGGIRSEAGRALLEQSTHHRRSGARQKAYAALARQRDPRVMELLGRGLRDSSAEVRGLCARLLGELRGVDQLELLFRALARGVPEAGTAIGTLAPGSEVARFDVHLQGLPIQVMLDGYERFLLRNDIDEQTKLAIVARLGEVGSPTVKQFLQRMLAAHDWSKQKALRHALEETSRRIVAAPKAPGSAK
jgi:HEAT repeat protein